jgi:hypothetical protein
MDLSENFWIKTLEVRLADCLEAKKAGKKRI